MSDTFNWRLPPAPGFPGYKPPPQQPPPSTTTVDGRPLTSPRAPPPDYSNEPYIPSRDRPHSDWAEDDWAMQGARDHPGVVPGPFMPQPREFAELLHGITMGMGRWGSHYSGMPAIAMGTYASAYWKAYQSGMKERAGQAWEQYRQAHQMFLDRQKEELQAARDGYALYGDNPDKLHQYMMGLVSKYHDNALENALAIDPAHVEKLWQYRDSKWQDAAKIKEQQDRRKIQDDILREHYRDLQERRAREEERRKEAERIRKQWDPSAVGPGPDYRPEPLPPAPTLPATEGETAPTDTESTPAENAPAESTPAASAPGGDAEADTAQPQQPIQVADASGQVPIGGGQAASPSPARGFGEGLLPEGKPESDPIERAAKDWVLNGHKLPQSLTKKDAPLDIAGRVERRGGQLENQLDNIARNPNLKGDAVYDAVGKVFPDFANDLKLMVDGDMATPRPGVSANNDFWRRVFSLGKKADPEFNASTFAVRQKALQFWTSGAGGNKLTSVATAYKHLGELLAATEAGKKPYQDFSTGITEFLATHFGKGSYKEFENKMNTAMHEYENALAASGASGGGAATIPAMKHQEKELTLNMNTANFKKDVRDKIDRLGERLEELESQYVSGTGRPMSGIIQRFDEFNKKEAPQYKYSDPERYDNMMNAKPRLDEIQSRNQTKKTPTAGAIENGWKFKGGDPGKRENWEKQ